METKTTLAEELEFAAMDTDYTADRFNSTMHRERSARLRARANLILAEEARLRELVAEGNEFAAMALYELLKLTDNLL